MKTKKSTLMTNKDGEAIDAGETNGRGDGVVTCCGELGAEHMPITFPGHFRALCPLCAAIAAAKDAEERADAAIETAAEGADDARDDRDQANNRLRQAETALANAADRIKSADRNGILDAAAGLSVAADIAAFLVDLRSSTLD